MRFQTVALLAGATAVAADTVSLLLPGFQNQQIQASSIAATGDTTTYLVNCPAGVPQSSCGIPGSGITAMAAPTSMQLLNAYQGTTASMSCNLGGMTYALCSALDNVAGSTKSTSGTLAPTDLNWMPVNLVPCTSATPTPTSTPTPTPTPAVSTVVPTSTATPCTSSMSSASPSFSSSTVSPTHSMTVSSSRSVGASSTALPSGWSSSTALTGTTAPSASSTPSPVANAAAPMMAGKVQWAVSGVALALAFVFA